MEIKEFEYLSVEEAIVLHIFLMRDWSEERFGVDKKDLLESAINRPKQAATFEDADIVRQGATLCYGLVKNHPFLGGNKRTASYLTEYFLALNGFEVVASDRELYSLVLNVESDTWETSDIEQWLRKRIAPIGKLTSIK